jgi:hypothetical protein
MENVGVDGSVIQTVHKTRVSACYIRQGKGHMNCKNRNAVYSDIYATLICVTIPLN